MVIPARLESSRLPRKLLAEICGETMLKRTHDVAVAAGCGPVVVLADSEEIAAEVRSFGGEVWLTDPELESGTARIASVAERLGTEIVVNLQGDAPLTDPAVVARCAREAAASGAPVTMPVYPILSEQDVHDPNVVKVACASSGRVLYCSRSPIPHARDAAGKWTAAARYLGHVGMYAYTQSFLLSFAGLPASELERTERLEQLRWLEAGLDLHGFEVPPQGPSVDTEAQLAEARALFAVRLVDGRPGYEHGSVHAAS